MNPFKKQSGFALPLAILIVVILVAAGGTGYYFYKTSKTPVTETKAPQKEAEEIGRELEEYFEEYKKNPTREALEKYQLTYSKLKDFIKDLKDPLVCEQFERLEHFGIRNDCLSNVAKNLKDSSVCDKISPESSQLRSSCYTEVAVVLKDPSICDKISTADPKFLQPQSDCYTKVAVALKDYSICGKIISPASPGLTSSCYTKVAIALKDPSGCEKIIKAPYKDICYQSIAINLEDFSVCEKIEKLHYKDGCYEGIGRSLGDVAIGLLYQCEQTSDECERNQCFIDLLGKRESFKSFKGEDICPKVTTKKVSECSPSTIIGGNYQDYCYSILEGATVNIRNCEEMENVWSSYRRDRCYWGCATLKNDPTFCEKMESEFKFSCYAGFDDISICKKLLDLSEKYKCYIEYSVRHHYSPTCEEIQAQLGTDLDTCYLDVAKQQSGINFSFCKKINSQAKKDLCYLSLIERVVAWNNPSFCEEIEPQDKKDVCYSKIAVRRKNSEFCEKIKSQNIKEQCFKQIK